MQKGPVTTTELLALALPAALGALLQQAYRPLDQFFAQYVGPDAQSALGASTFVGILVFAVAASVAGGVGPLVGRATGADDVHDRARVFGTGLAMTLCVGGAVSLAAALGASSVASWLGLVDGEATATTAYLWWLGLTGVALSVQPSVDAAFNAMGYTRSTMVLQGVTVALNTLFTGVFVLVFDAGVAGAAIGTTLAQTLVTGAGLVWLWRVMGRFPLLLDLDIAVRILRVGAPVGLSVGAYALVYWLLIRTSIAPLGEMKGLAVGFSALEAMSWPLFAGWSIAVASLVARRLGAGQPDEARRAVRLAMPWSLGLGVGVAFAFGVGGPWLVAGFSADGVVQGQGIVYASALAWSQPFVALEALFEGVLLGSGDTRRLAAVTIPSNALRVPLAWALAIPLGLGIVGVWWAINLTTVLKAGLKGMLVWRGQWAKTEV